MAQIYRICKIKFADSSKKWYFWIPNKGRMAERLGTGLQNLLHRFESGSDLKKIKTPLIHTRAFLFYSHGHFLLFPKIKGYR